MRSLLLNGGAYACVAALLVGVTAEAAQTGAFISRVDYDAKSAKLAIPYKVSFAAAGETLSVAVAIKHANVANGAGAVTYGDAVPATIILTADAAGDKIGVVEVDVNFDGAHEFVTAQITLATSAAGTVNYSAQFVLFGSTRNPSTGAIATVESV